MYIRVDRRKQFVQGEPNTFLQPDYVKISVLLRSRCSGTIVLQLIILYKPSLVVERTVAFVLGLGNKTTLHLIYIKPKAYGHYIMGVENRKLRKEDG